MSGETTEAQQLSVLHRIAEAAGLALSKRSAIGIGDLWFMLPGMHVQVKLDQMRLAFRPDFDQLMKQVDDAKRRLFAMVRKHIAEHDRSPTDRLEQLEAASRRLLEAMGENFIRWSTGPVADACREIDQVLRAKPGATSWDRDVSDPPEMPRG